MGNEVTYYPCMEQRTREKFLCDIVIDYFFENRKLVVVLSKDTSRKKMMNLLMSYMSPKQKKVADKMEYLPFLVENVSPSTFSATIREYYSDVEKDYAPIHFIIYEAYPDEDLQPVADEKGARIFVFNKGKYVGKNHGNRNSGNTGSDNI